MPTLFGILINPIKTLLALGCRNNTDSVNNARPKKNRTNKPKHRRFFFFLIIKYIYKLIRILFNYEINYKIYEIILL